MIHNQGLWLQHNDTFIALRNFLNTKGENSPAPSEVLLEWLGAVLYLTVTDALHFDADSTTCPFSYTLRDDDATHQHIGGLFSSLFFAKRTERSFPFPTIECTNHSDADINALLRYLCLCTPGRKECYECFAALVTESLTSPDSLLISLHPLLAKTMTELLEDYYEYANILCINDELGMMGHYAARHATQSSSLCPGMHNLEMLAHAISGTTHTATLPPIADNNKYDCILCNLLDTSESESRNQLVLCDSLLTDQCTDNCTMVVIANSRALAMLRRSNIMIRRRWLHTVVELPAGTLRDTSHRCFLLLIDKSRSHDQCTFVMADECGQRYDKEFVVDAARIKHRLEAGDGLDVEYYNIEFGRHGLEPSHYLQMKEDDMPYSYSHIRLSHLLEPANAETSFAQEGFLLDFTYDKIDRFSLAITSEELQWAKIPIKQYKHASGPLIYVYRGRRELLAKYSTDDQTIHVPARHVEIYRLRTPYIHPGYLCWQINELANLPTSSPRVIGSLRGRTISIPAELNEASYHEQQRLYEEWVARKREKTLSGMHLGEVVNNRLREYQTLIRTRLRHAAPYLSELGDLADEMRDIIESTDHTEQRTTLLSLLAEYKEKYSQYVSLVDHLDSDNTPNSPAT